jgi:oxygen-independent coproporphyrinogen-3 oxidase
MMRLQQKASYDGSSCTDPAQRLGVYCHVPFCASSCDFCAFYQEKPRREDLNRYLAGMELEFQRLPHNRPVQTVFWGGGTPGLLPAKDLELMGTALLNNLQSPPEEWTIEMAPSTVKADKLAVLRDLGVTRISMGVQSFHAQRLEALGRLHRPKQIYSAWERIQAAGFPQTNLDLMFALPGQTLDEWIEGIQEAAALGPNHLSTYCLTFEEDTALYVRLAKGALQIDPEREHEFYVAGWRALAELGYAQYEISNFARPGGQCQHNIDTWRMQEWIGCGPSAASQYQGWRFQRPANLDAWLEQVSMSSQRPADAQALDSEMLTVDALIFGLRMNVGCNLPHIAQRWGATALMQRMRPFLERLQVEGYAHLDQGRLSLSESGRLLVDSIAVGLMESLEK